MVGGRKINQAQVMERLTTSYSQREAAVLGVYLQLTGQPGDFPPLTLVSGTVARLDRSVGGSEGVGGVCGQMEWVIQLLSHAHPNGC